MIRMKHRHNNNNSNLKLKGGMRGVKFLIFIFSFIFLVFGIKMIVVGSILNLQFKDYLDFQGNLKKFTTTTKIFIEFNLIKN